MKKIILILSMALLLNSCGSIEKYNMQILKTHTISELRDDIDDVYDQLQRHHPHLYQFTGKEVLDFKFDSLKKAITPMTSRMFFKALVQVTKHVRQGHLSLTPPNKQFNKKERKKLIGSKFAINNLDFEFLDNKLWVVNARKEDSVLAVSEVLKINNEKSIDLINKYKTWIASDGYNTTLHNRVVGERFLRYYYNDKGRYDSIELTFKKNDSVFVKQYKRILKSQVAKQTKDSIGGKSLDLISKKLTKAEKKAKKEADKLKEKHNQKYGFIKSRNEYTRNFNFIGKDSTVAYLKIRGFQNGKFKDFYTESFDSISKINTKALVIDLRDNFGGRLEEIAYLYGFLTDKNFIMINPSEVKSRIPFLKALMSNTSPIGFKIFLGLISPIELTRSVLRTKKNDGKIYYNFKFSKSKKPQPLNYTGPIYVLINGNSFSASSVLSSHLHGNKNVTFVGEETGGAYNGTVAGVYKQYTLPNSKIKARIGMMHIDAPKKTTKKGYGIVPDVKITPSIDDRVTNTDPELKYVLDAIYK